MPVLRALGVVAVVLVGALLAALTVFVTGVRTRDKRVLRFARVLQRDVMNPGALRDAGSAGSAWAVVRVPGRKTGRIYDTPVGVMRDGEHLFIALPYGEGTQWLRNVLAADGATILHDGAELQATEPEVLPIDRTPLARTDRAAIAVFGVTHALRLRAASVPSAAPEPAPA